MAINILKFKGDTLELNFFESYDGWFGVTSVCETVSLSDINPFDKMLVAIQKYGAGDHQIKGYEFGNQAHRKLQKLFDDACMKAQEIYEDEILGN